MVDKQQHKAAIGRLLEPENLVQVVSVHWLFYNQLASKVTVKVVDLWEKTDRSIQAGGEESPQIQPCRQVSRDQKFCLSFLQHAGDHLRLADWMEFKHDQKW